MRIDLSRSLDWREDLPRPDWELAYSHIETTLPEAQRAAAWNDALTQWLDHLCDACEGYAWLETPHFFLFGPRDAVLLRALTNQSEAYRREISATIPHFAEFVAPGKLPLLVWNDDDSYYRYVADFYEEEGTFGTSGGMYIRVGYPHITLRSFAGVPIGPALAHELTHAALGAWKLPQWIEEGLAQMFEKFGGGAALQLDPREAKLHRRYWRRRGLTTFWFGDGFHTAGGVQRLSYQLAAVFVELLVESHRPRWFGLARGRQEHFVEFLRHADPADAGEAAAEEHLGYGLETLAEKFLGPGDWSPRSWEA